MNRPRWEPQTRKRSTQENFWQRGNFSLNDREYQSLSRRFAWATKVLQQNKKEGKR